VTPGADEEETMSSEVPVEGASPRSPRRADVFFYGLFMDEELLRDKGVSPTDAELASVRDLELRIGERAALAPAPSRRVHGVVMSLTVDDIERLYAEPSVRAYEPNALLVELDRGGVVAALCYNLPVPPPATARNPEYAAKLRAIAEKVGLPAGYVDGIGS
jgi:hypothetical protein